MCLGATISVSVLSARQVRNWGRDPARKNREGGGRFCIHGDGESRIRKPTGSQGVPHSIGEGGLFRCHDAVNCCHGNSTDSG